jgi:hypothetical protein
MNGQKPPTEAGFSVATSGRMWENLDEDGDTKKTMKGTGHKT